MNLLKRTDDGGAVFWCPGCKDHHHITSAWRIHEGAAPTVEPSVLVRSGHHAPGFDGAKDVCWCTYNVEHPEDAAPFACGVCHSFVRGGQIEFLSDCTHGLAGKTVPMEPLPC